MSSSCASSPAVGTALADKSASGAFVRKAAMFRDFVASNGSTEYLPESGRYLLYISYACPWACRCLAYIKIKGLEDAIRVAVVAPVWQRTKPSTDNHKGWVFDDSVEGATADPIFGAKTMREVYEKSKGGETAARFTVPVLFDTKSGRIVSNESSEIIRMLNTEFNAFAKHPEIDLYPTEHRAEIDAMNAEIYAAINDGVYKCGFAEQQAPYDEASAALFAALEKYDALLATRRFLVGSVITEADIRFVQTLLRFDEVYVVHFKTNSKPIRYFSHLAPYLADVYQSASLASTVNMHHIKHHYFLSHPELNPAGIVPRGNNEVAFLASCKHGREALGGAENGSVFYRGK